MVTRHELRKKLQEVQQLGNTSPVHMGGSHINNNITETSTPTEDTEKVTLVTKDIIKVKTTTLIAKDGTKAELYNPLPGVFWKAVGSPESDGTITLKKSITGLFIGDGKKYYCLGVTGDTDEFELRCVLGKNEVRISKSYLNIVANRLVKNGLEEKKSNPGD